MWRIIAGIVFMTVLVGGGQGSVAADVTAPDPSLGPEQVARIQIEALGRNDVPYKDRGIEVTWNFASPTNKRFTGPLERFKRMVHNPAYEPMVNHQNAQIENLKVAGDHAELDVILKTRESAYVGFHFTLSRHKVESCDACWMTDSVMRFEVNVH